MRGIGGTPLRIALIAPSQHPIRQPFAGGLEALVWHLARSLRARGHQVTLFAAADSDDVDPALAFPAVPWRASALAAGDASMPARDFMSDHHGYLRLMMGLVEGGDRFDVIHNHALHHLPVAMAPLLRVPMVTTLHTPPTPWLESAVEVTGGAPHFTAVSDFIADSWHALPTRPRVVRNGVDLADWPLGVGGPHLVWSGRMVPEKAPHLAIAAARRAGLGLRLAGPVADRDYFDAQVRPRLGGDVRYAGHLDQPELARLVGRSAAALVTPVWDEPYGLVVAEALACGTPVVAFARGGVPEVVAGPSGGLLVPPGDVPAMAAAVSSAVLLDRREVRRHADRTLSHERMVDGYVAGYRRLVSTARHAPAASWYASPSRANAVSQPSIGTQPHRS